MGPFDNLQQDLMNLSVASRWAAEKAANPTEKQPTIKDSTTSSKKDATQSILNRALTTMKEAAASIKSSINELHVPKKLASGVKDAGQTLEKGFANTSQTLEKGFANIREKVSTALSKPEAIVNPEQDGGVIKLNKMRSMLRGNTTSVEKKQADSPPSGSINSQPVAQVKTESVSKPILSPQKETLSQTETTLQAEDKPPFGSNLSGHAPLKADSSSKPSNKATQSAKGKGVQTSDANSKANMIAPELKLARRLKHVETSFKDLQHLPKEKVEKIMGNLAEIKGNLAACEQKLKQIKSHSEESIQLEEKNVLGIIQDTIRECEVTLRQCEDEIIGLQNAYLKEKSQVVNSLKKLQGSHTADVKELNDINNKLVKSVPQDKKLTFTKSNEFVLKTNKMSRGVHKEISVNTISKILDKSSKALENDSDNPQLLETVATLLKTLKNSDVVKNDESLKTKTFGLNAKLIEAGDKTVIKISTSLKDALKKDSNNQDLFEIATDFLNTVKKSSWSISGKHEVEFLYFEEAYNQAAAQQIDESALEKKYPSVKDSFQRKVLNKLLNPQNSEIFEFQKNYLYSYRLSASGSLPDIKAFDHLPIDQRQAAIDKAEEKPEAYANMSALEAKDAMDKAKDARRSANFIKGFADALESAPTLYEQSQMLMVVAKWLSDNQLNNEEWKDPSVRYQLNRLIESAINSGSPLIEDMCNKYIKQKIVGLEEKSTLELQKQEALVDGAININLRLDEIAQGDILPNSPAYNQYIELFTSDLNLLCIADFVSVDSSDFLTENQTKYNSAAAHSGQITNYILIQILTQKTPESRANLIRFFLKAQEKLLTQGKMLNIAAYAAIGSALVHGYISRLKNTTALLNKAESNLLSEAERLSNPQHLLKHTREMIDRASKEDKIVIPTIMTQKELIMKAIESATGTGVITTLGPAMDETVKLQKKLKEISVDNKLSFSAHSTIFRNEMPASLDSAPLCTPSFLTDPAGPQASADVISEKSKNWNEALYNLSKKLEPSK